VLDIPRVTVWVGIWAECMFGLFLITGTVTAVTWNFYRTQQHQKMKSIMTSKKCSGSTKRTVYILVIANHFTLKEDKIG
jgi:hypothetical protein